MFCIESVDHFQATLIPPLLSYNSFSCLFQNPSVAIPKGTLLAIIISGISYLACLWLLGASVVRDASGKFGIESAVGECPYGLMNSYRVRFI